MHNIKKSNVGQKEKFVTSLDKNKSSNKGFDGDIIALWQSHGWYFEPKMDRWEWQRARIFQTVEDLYTQSYVIPYLMPMLENAGAYVISPRERDVNTTEIIVDNDGGLSRGDYKEHNEHEKWIAGKSRGFAYNRAQYENNQNPFKEGTYRQVNTNNDDSKLSKT